MPTKLEIMQELDKRGKLPPDKKILFDEAVKRGLVPGSQPATTDFPQRDFMGALGEGLSTIPGTIGGAIGDTASTLYESTMDPMGPIVNLTKKAGKGVLDAISGLGDLGAGTILNIPGIENLGPIGPEGERMRDLAANVGGNLKKDWGSGQGLLNQIATRPIGMMTDLASVAMGGEGLLLRGANLANKANKVGLASKLSKAAEVSGKVGKYTNPISLVTEPATSLMNKAAARVARKAAAESVGVGPKGLETVAGSVGPLPQAEARLNELGPSGAVFNTSPQALQDARAVASMPATTIAGRQGLSDLAQKQVDDASTRFNTDWHQTMGPSLTKHSAELAKEATQQGVSSLYDAAKKVKVDINPVIDSFIDGYNKNLNNIKGLVTLNSKQKYMTNPLTGNLIDSAEELLNLRKSIDEKIRKIGKDQTMTPGANVFQLGSSTQEAIPLMNIRRKINETLHKDKDFALADKTFSHAENVDEAYNYGFDNIIGTGDKMPDPSKVKKYYDELQTTEEKSAFHEGISRRGQLMHGDVTPNRNSGASVSNKIATENNLARIESVTSPQASENLRKLAAREDALAGGSNEILHGSATAKTSAAMEKFKLPADQNIKDLAMGGVLATSPIALVMNPGLIAPLAMAATTLGLRNKLKRTKAIKTLNDTAKLMAKTGPEAKGVLKAIEEFNKSPTKKSAKGLTQYMTGAYQASKATEITPVEGGYNVNGRFVPKQRAN